MIGIKKKLKAQEVLVVRMEEKHLTHILACGTAQEMWQKVKSIYEHQLQVNVHLLKQMFFNTEYKEGGTVEFFSVIEEIKQMGEEISDKLIVTEVLSLQNILFLLGSQHQVIH